MKLSFSRLTATSFLIFLLGCLASPDSPNLIYPPDGDTVSTSQVTFQWSEVMEVDYYNLEIDGEESFLNPVVVTDSLTQNFHTLDLSYPDSPLQGQETYYWRVGALKEGWTSWSDVQSFYNANEERP